MRLSSLLIENGYRFPRTAGRRPSRGALPLALRLLSLVIILMGCQESSAQAPANLADYTKLEVVSNEKVAYKGQPGVVEFKLTNTSTSDVWVVEPGLCSLEIELFNSQGKELFSCLGVPCCVSAGFYDLRKLAPGQSLTRVKAMAYGYPMKAPGAYTIRARYTMKRDYDGRINGEFLNTPLPFAGSVFGEL